MENMKTVLMAGGRKTRITELFPDIPKSLILIQNISVLEREICSLRNQGFKNIILTIGYMAEKINYTFGMIANVEKLCDVERWMKPFRMLHESMMAGLAVVAFSLHVQVS